MISLDFANIQTDKHYVFSIPWAKNVVLPLLFFASGLAYKYQKDVCLSNIPNLGDVSKCVEFLRHLWVYISRQNSLNGIQISWKLSCLKNTIDATLYSEFRYSILSLGLLLSFFDSISIPSKTWGCNIGERKNDIHYAFFWIFWYTFIDDHEGGIMVRKEKYDQITHLKFHPHIASTSVTENILLFLVLSYDDLESINIQNFYAIRPEISELMVFCERFWYIFHHDENALYWITLHEVNNSQEIFYHILADFDQALFYICFACVLRMDLLIENFDNVYSYQEFVFLEKIFSIRLNVSNNTLEVKGTEAQYRWWDICLYVNQYPNIMSDSQPILSVVGIFLDKITIIDTRYPWRYWYHEYFQLFGFKTTIWKNSLCMTSSHSKTRWIEIPQVIPLYSIRESWLLLLLWAYFRAKMHIDNIYFLQRGYEGIFEKLSHMGVEITTYT